MTVKVHLCIVRCVFVPYCINEDGDDDGGFESERVRVRGKERERKRFE